MKKRFNAEIRKPEIIRTFYNTILEEGFEGASIAKVAARIDMHPSLIIHYFQNKENLTLALVNYVIAEYSKLLTRGKVSDIGPELRLRRLLETLWSKEYLKKFSIAGSFSVISISFRNKNIQKKIKKLYELFKIFLIQELSILNDQKIISVNNPERAAEVIISMIEGSRHFSHFFVSNSVANEYRKNMIQAAAAYLKNPVPEE